MPVTFSRTCARLGRSPCLKSAATWSSDRANEGAGRLLAGGDHGDPAEPEGRVLGNDGQPSRRNSGGPAARASAVLGKVAAQRRRPSAADYAAGGYRLYPAAAI